MPGKIADSTQFRQLKQMIQVLHPFSPPTFPGPARQAPRLSAARMNPLNFSLDFGLAGSHESKRYVRVVISFSTRSTFPGKKSADQRATKKGLEPLENNFWLLTSKVYFCEGSPFFIPLPVLHHCKRDATSLFSCRSISREI